ncbi:FAD-binding oxidoreductase [Streptomyces sp. HUCO-GS316]|uniref:FAD-binding oxidoreductase n=1 Tax=Streptomyces sp. HUCO-GS316 TaxID=2692198 RepID=UPI001F425E02|nr:FAD-linked oxidase C-terminal domain-containing protein [Streptomyces sp. HUCO-GS316]
MNRILDLNPHDQIAVVEPGVITTELDGAAGEFGLRCAPDPAGAAISTGGGNIATHAGGLRCAKYGGTRDAVLGLDVALADGTPIRTGRRTVQGVTGYDLTALFTGSEGSLGVITAVTLRLRPVPESTATVAAYFDTFAEGAEAVSALTAARLEPAMAELLDGPGARRRGRRTGHRPAVPWWSVAACAVRRTRGGGRGGTGGTAAARARDSVETTADPAEADRLLAARRLALPALERLGRVLIEDIAVPRSRLADAVHEITAAAERRGVRIFTFAHAADGNLHPILVLDPGTPGIPDAAWQAAGDIFTAALCLGGTLTGEHGVGALKRRWLADELGPQQHALQQRIKTAFDPHHILNPGKTL